MKVRGYQSSMNKKAKHLRKQTRKNAGLFQRAIKRGK